MLVLTIMVLCLPLASGVTFTQTWADHLRTGTINAQIFGNIGTYYYTGTLSPAMKSTAYSCAYGLSGLNQGNINQYTYYQLYSYVFSRSLTSLTLYLKHSSVNSTKTTNYIGVRYLLVEPNFPFLTPMHLNLVLSPYIRYSKAAPSQSYSLTNTQALPLDATNDYLVHVVNNYMIQNANAGSNIISMESHCWISNITTVLCQVKTPLDPPTFRLHKWGVDVVAVHYQRLRDRFSNNVWFSDLADLGGSSVSNSWPFPNSTTDSKLFYGFKSLTKNTVVPYTPFNFSIASTSSALSISLGVQPQNITAFYLIFNPLVVDCYSNTFWNSSTFTCECLSTQYYNISGSCVDCSTIHPDCLECSSSGCSNCSGAMVVYGSGCASCDLVWSNCSDCTSTQCLNCFSPFLFRSGSCLTCGEVTSGCETCNDSTCLSCDLNHFLQAPSCTPCRLKWANCLECDSVTCFNCSGQYKTAGADCFLCGDRWLGCSECTALSGCSACLYPYILSAGICVGNCSLIQYCQTCSVDNWKLKCSQCDPGYKVSSEFVCVPDCGDGLLMVEEECDDRNLRVMDGCSSSCLIQQYFSCNSTLLPSFCTLIEMNTSVVCIAKTEDKNQIVVTLEISPQGVVYYDDAQWINAFNNAHHLLNVSWVKYDRENSRLRVGFQYRQILKGVSITIGSELTLASANFNLSAVSLSLPSTAKNNQALYVYQDSTYFLASMVQYGSYLVGGISILMLVLGYFGSKLQSLEGIAVIQVSALLLMTVEQMGPTYNGLKFLKISLGITPIFSDSYYYEDSTIPTHLNTILIANDSVSNINILLSVFFVPILVGVILMILNKVKYPQNFRMERMWKYAFGTFTFYGLLFLSYGEFSSLFLNIRYFSTDVSALMGMGAGVLFSILMTLWLVAFCKYSVWFGSFKNRFYIFGLPRFFYFISACERVLTALVIVCLSPGFIASSIVGGIFVVETIMIVCRRPYGMGGWKRPLFNKIVASLISFLYVGASLTGTESFINQLIPMAIIGLLLSVIIVAIIASVFALKEHCSSQAQGMKADGSKFAPPLPVEQANRLLLKDFEMKMMPSILAQNHPIWQPVQHQSIDIDKWKWEQYPILTSTEVPLRVRMRREVEKMKKNEEEDKERDREKQGREEDGSESEFIKNLRKIREEKGKSPDEVYGQI